MSKEMTITPFSTGIHRGLILQYFNPALVSNVTINLDLSEWYERSLINRISSIEMFSQYGRLVATDSQSGIKRYANSSSMVNHVLNTRSRRFKLLYANSSGMSLPAEFSMVFYESPQPTMNQVVVLP